MIRCGFSDEFDDVRRRWRSTWTIHTPPKQQGNAQIGGRVLVSIPLSRWKRLR